MENFEDERKLRGELQRLVTFQQQLLDASPGGLSAEDQEIYNRAEADFDNLSKKLKTIERQRQFSRSLREPHRGDPEDGRSLDLISRFDQSDPKQIRLYEPGTFKSHPFNIQDSDQYQEVRDLNQYFQMGMVNLPEATKARFFNRALQMDVQTAGGYLVAGELFSERVIESLMNLVFIRPLATIITCPTAQSLGAPALDNDPGDPTWGSELSTGENDTEMNFEKRQLYPHPLARRIKVSNTLIRRNSTVSELVKRRLAYKFAVVEEANFLGGDGSQGDGQNKPLGVFTVSDQGITTARDISDGNTTTAIKADNLINVKYALKAQYRRNASWIFHRDAVKMIRKLKDADGNYVWRLGISSDRPDTILDLPFNESEYAPSTFSSGKYVGILGDFSFYWIADALDMQIQVLTELYAETNQTGFIGRKEADGMPVLEEAFVRVKLGT